jgi:hypothetical protein
LKPHVAKQHITAEIARNAAAGPRAEESVMNDVAVVSEEDREQVQVEEERGVSSSPRLSIWDAE